MITLLCLVYKWTNKAWMIAHLLTTWFTEHFKPYTAQNKKSPFKVLLLIDKGPGHPKALMHNEMKVVLMPADTTSILQLMDQ